MGLAYISLNIFIVMAVIVVFRMSVRWPARRTWLALGGLFILTAVFDNLMIWIGAFEYTAESIMGVRVGLAPVEDFFYPLVAVMLVTTLWQRYEPTEKKG